jgi:hypothetical protein
MDTLDVINTTIPKKHFKTAKRRWLRGTVLILLMVIMPAEYLGVVNGVGQFIINNLLLILLIYLLTWNDIRKVDFQNEFIRIYFPIRLYHKEIIIPYAKIFEVTYFIGYVTGGRSIIFDYWENKKEKKSWIYGDKEDFELLKSFLIERNKKIKYFEF